MPCSTISSGAGCGGPEFLIVDGAPRLEGAFAVVWDGAPAQRCTVHKHRNLLAHAPEGLDEITADADYNDMIYAATREEIEAGRKASSANGASSIVPWRQPAGSGDRPSPPQTAAEPVEERAHNG
ncbi:hypothetical protein ACVJGD_008372 [Bradyrhizobium sp. USDA 10063]